MLTFTYKSGLFITKSRAKIGSRILDPELQIPARVGEGVRIRRPALCIKYLTSTSLES